MKVIARSYLPPKVYEGLRKLRVRLAPGSSGNLDASPADLQILGNTWPSFRGRDVESGWLSQGISVTHARKWPRFLELTSGNGPLGLAHESEMDSAESVGAQNTVLVFAYALGLAIDGRHSASMLDWGGGPGHYYELARTLFPEVRLQYWCKEVAGMVRLGQTLIPEGHFVETVNQLLPSYDLVLASGSIHYSPRWASTMAELSRVTGRYLLVSRLPTVQIADSFVFKQRAYGNGYDTELASWCVNRTQFLETAGRLSLDLVRSFVIDERFSFAGLDEPCQFVAYLFRPRTLDREGSAGPQYGRPPDVGMS